MTARSKLKASKVQNSQNAVQTSTELTSILTTDERLKIALFFRSKKQIEFINSLMIIKTESKPDTGKDEMQSKGAGVADLLVLKRMKKIYEQSSSLGRVSAIVCKALIVRIRGGMGLGEAMYGMFSDSFCTLMSAKAANSDITSAIKGATERQSEVFRVELVSTIKLYAGFFILILAGNAMNLVHSFYEERKAQIPKAFKFFKEPELKFLIADFIANFTIPLILLVFTASIINRYVLPKLSGKVREKADSYYPPAVLYRSKLAMSLFSNIALLIKDAGIQPRLAIDKLLIWAKPYERDHLDMIKASIVSGAEGTDQFSTGLLPDELELKLKLAGQGEKASIKTALNIICNTGQRDLVNQMKRLSTLLMLILGGIGVWVLAGGLSVGMAVMKSLGA